MILLLVWIASGLVYSHYGAEVLRLRRLVQDAARLQRINRIREGKGFPILYNPDIDKELPAN